jgi:hypothetical protein
MVGLRYRWSKLSHWLGCTLSRMYSEEEFAASADLTRPFVGGAPRQRDCWSPCLVTISPRRPLSREILAPASFAPFIPESKISLGSKEAMNRLRSEEAQRLRPSITKRDVPDFRWRAQ